MLANDADTLRGSMTNRLLRSYIDFGNVSREIKQSRNSTKEAFLAKGDVDENEFHSPIQNRTRTSIGSNSFLERTEDSLSDISFEQYKSIKRVGSKKETNTKFL